MIKVTTLARIADCIPLFPFDLGFFKHVNFIRKLFITLVVVYFIKAYTSRIEPVTEMYTLSTNCILIFNMAASGYCVWHLLSGMGDRWLVGERIVDEVHRIIMEHSDLTTDWYLMAGIFLQMATWLGYTAQCVYFSWDSIEAWSWFYSGLIVFSTLGHLILIKAVVYEEFKVRMSKLSTCSVPELMANIRPILDLNQDVNELYSPLVSVCIILSVAQVIRCVVNIWVFFGLHSNLTWYDPHYLCSCLRYAVKFLLLVFTVHACCRVSSLVDDLKTDLERLATFQESPLDYRMLIVTALQELDHFPQDLQGFELFTVNCASVVDVCGFAVNFGMLMVQLLK